MYKYKNGSYMNCKNLKQKLDRTLYCKYKKSDIKISECSNCIYKEYKTIERKNNKTCSIKQRTYKQAKAEKNRFSLFTNDLDHCIICNRSPTNKHEIFFGSKHRHLSIKYGLIIPLCTVEHHNQIEKKGIHYDKELQLYWKRKGQAMFEEKYPDLDFLEIFHENYLGGENNDKIK